MDISRGKTGEYLILCLGVVTAGTHHDTFTMPIDCIPKVAGAYLYGNATRWVGGRYTLDDAARTVTFNFYDTSNGTIRYNWWVFGY